MIPIVPPRARVETYCPPPPPAALWLARGAMLTALCIALLLGAVSLLGGSVPGCGADGGWFDCSLALGSKFGRWLGVPVGIPAVGVYSIALLALLAIGPGGSQSSQRNGWALLLVLAVVVAGAAAWFIGVVAFNPAYRCPWCLAAHACSLLAVGVVLWHGPWRAGAAGRRAMPLRTARNLGCAGLVGWLVLVLGQWYGPEPPLQVFGGDGKQLAAADRLASPPQPADADSATKPSPYAATTDADPPASKAGDSVSQPKPDEKAAGKTSQDEKPLESVEPAGKDHSPDGAGLPESLSLSPDLTVGNLDTSIFKLPEASNLPEKVTANRLPVAEAKVYSEPEHRELELPAGKTKLDLIDVPMLGSRRAAIVAVELYDYTCPHCRMMYQYLELSRKRYGATQFAVALCPAPLNSACNPYVTSTSRRHRDACEYAKLALAVWKADYEKFAAFHEFLMKDLDEPSLKDARAEANRLVGADKLRTTLADDWVSERLRAHAEIDNEANKSAPHTLPKLMIGPYIQAAVPSTNQMFEFFEKRLGMRPTK